MDLPDIDSIGGCSDLVACHVSINKSICLVLEIHGEIVGYLCSTSDMYIHQLLDIFIAPQYRREHLGSYLIDHLKLMTWPSMSIEAIVDMGDVASISFLKSNMFTAVEMPNKDSVTFRFGWRFRHAPPLSFRRTQAQDD
jgi:ribosomal protein S18 acetylase RimI-like enzyme